jgi:hypothetical protein
MKNKIKNIIMLLVFLLSTGSSIIPASAIAAVDCSRSDLTTQQAIQCGANGAGGTTQSAAQGETNLDKTVKTVVNLLTVIVGLVAVVMIVVAGFRYITSGGKQESVAAAKNGLAYAIIGLVVAALAQVIARFVLVHVA